MEWLTVVSSPHWEPRARAGWTSTTSIGKPVNTSDCFSLTSEQLTPITSHPLSTALHTCLYSPVCCEFRGVLALAEGNFGGIKCEWTGTLKNVGNRILLKSYAVIKPANLRLSYVCKQSWASTKFFHAFVNQKIVVNTFFLFWLICFILFFLVNSIACWEKKIVLLCEKIFLIQEHIFLIIIESVFYCLKNWSK